MTQSSGGSYTIPTKVVAPDALCLADHPAAGAKLAIPSDKGVSTASAFRVRFTLRRDQETMAGRSFRKGSPGPNKPEGWGDLGEFDTVLRPCSHRKVAPR
jgi:hypothetical protein